MLQIKSWLAITLAVGLITGCTSNRSVPLSTPGGSSDSSHSMPKVVATHSVLCDLVKQIAQDSVNLTCLVKAGMDPHVYAPTPSDRKAIEEATLIFYNGYHFQPGIEKLIQSGARTATKVAVGEQAVSNPLMGEAEDYQGHGDQDAKDSAPDPHVWHNAQNGIKMVAIVESQLATLNPAQTKTYQKNADQLSQKLAAIDTWIKAQIKTIPVQSRKLVTTHDALGYFASAYSIPIEGALQGLSTEQKPAAARVKVLVDEIKTTKVPTIFAEVTANSSLLKTLAKDAGVKISEQELFADGLGEAGSVGDTYPKALIANTKAIVEGLGGRYVAFVDKR